MTWILCGEAGGGDLPPDRRADGEAGKAGLQWLWDLVAGCQQPCGQDGVRFADAG